MRVFKTRSMAAGACRAGRVSIDGAKAKPSRLLRRGDVVSVRKPTIRLQLRVLATLEKRVGAKAVADYAEDITPAEEKRAAAEAAAARRAAAAEVADRGDGRPSKRQRRKLEQFLDEVARGAGDPD